MLTIEGDLELTIEYDECVVVGIGINLLDKSYDGVHDVFVYCKLEKNFNSLQNRAIHSNSSKYHTRKSLKIDGAEKRNY